MIGRMIDMMEFKYIINESPQDNTDKYSEQHPHQRTHCHAEKLELILCNITPIYGEIKVGARYSIGVSHQDQLTGGTTQG